MHPTDNAVQSLRNRWRWPVYRAVLITQRETPGHWELIRLFHCAKHLPLEAWSASGVRLSRMGLFERPFPQDLLRFRHFSVANVRSGLELLRNLVRTSLNTVFDELPPPFIGSWQICADGQMLNNKTKQCLLKWKFTDRFLDKFNWRDSRSDRFLKMFRRISNDVKNQARALCCKSWFRFIWLQVIING